MVLDYIIVFIFLGLGSLGLALLIRNKNKNLVWIQGLVAIPDVLGSFRFWSMVCNTLHLIPN
jgi:hypothetical protein